ncbi:TrkH family potassium uptake protein [Gammaproteobacteria bacterium]|nr:TrkH family potassium uptake protein [Gammaproteobacteria bacterium]MDC3411339.1 TrkH family potassium uptake protein [Gammaproteobacteria bacterium]
MNFKPLLNLFSILVMFFSLSFVLPMIVSMIFEDSALNIFIITFISIFTLGLVGWFISKDAEDDLSQKDGFIIITFFWLVLSIAGSMPFILIGMPLIDAFFESMSGITTTGATVISNLSALPESILFYRQLLQWMGGMGLIVLAIAVMPLLGIGGGQLYKTEIPGAMNDQKLTPRIKETAQALWLIYLVLTVLCAIFYYFAGMSWFDAISHSLSTVSIGGFSTHNESIGYFNNGLVEAVCITFMLLSALSFTLHYFAFYMKKPFKYLQDPELKFFISILLVIFSISVMVNLFTLNSEASIRELLFHTVSIVTTTGFAIGDTSQWSPSISFLLLIGAFIGACSGSVGGGIKSWRVMIMINYAYINLQKMIHPNAVISLKIGTKNVENDVASSVWGFFSIYVISFIILLFGLVVTGLDFESSFSAIGACLNNLGPGLGEVSQTYETVSPVGKGILSFAMILGRLEIFTLLVLFTPAFWRG